MLTILDMAPPLESANKSWLLMPWLVETTDPLSFAYMLATTPLRGEDGDVEVLCIDLEATTVEQVNAESNCSAMDDTEEDILEDVAVNLPILEAEFSDVVIEMLNLKEPQLSCALLANKVIPFVEYGGHNIYKSTLVSQLNANPFLSKDRLTKVKNSIYFNNSDDYISASSSQETMLLGLGMDCGVYFMQQRTTASSSSGKTTTRTTRGRPSKNLQPTCVLNGIDEGTWCIGRVQKMTCKVGTRWGNCRHPIDLQQREVTRGKKPGTGEPSFMVYLNYFRKVPGFLKFKYDHVDSIWVDVDTIICRVTMSYDSKKDLFELDPIDGESLTEFVQKSK